MRPPTRRPAAVPALLAVLLAACSSAPSASPTQSAGPTAGPTATPATGDPTALVLREDFAGGFVAATAELTNLPVVSVYADGTVIVAADASAADAAIPGLRAAKLTSAGLRAVVDAAKAAGLGGADARLDGGPAADIPAARFTLVLDGHPHVVTASRLGNPTGADAAAVAKLAAFAGTLTVAGLGTDPATIGAWAAYAPAALRLLVVSHEAATGDPAPIAWPLPAALADFGDAVPTGTAGINPGVGGGVTLRCGAVTGADLATLLPALSAATTASLWSSGGRLYTVVIRPLLPDESGCL